MDLQQALTPSKSIQFQFEYHPPGPKLLFIKIHQTGVCKNLRFQVVEHEPYETQALQEDSSKIKDFQLRGELHANKKKKRKKKIFKGH